MGLGEAIDRLTNFVIYPIAKIETEEGSIYKALFVNTLAEEREISFSPKCLTSPAMFKSMLSEKTMGFCYFGNGKVMPLLQEYFSGLEWKTEIGVKASGIHFLGNKPVYVSREKAISYDNSPVCDLVQENDSCVIKSNILNYGYIVEEDLKPIGNALMSFNDPLRTVSVLAWCTACFIKQHLKEAAIKFLSLLLIGEAGSGKSTTLDHIIEPLFSCEVAASASGITEAALKKKIASSNMVPMLIEEFKPGKMEKSQVNTVCNYLRNVYDGNASENIMGLGKVKSFIPTAPVVLVGEQDVDEPAIRERSIKVLFSKRGLKNHTERYMTATNA